MTLVPGSMPRMTLSMCGCEDVVIVMVWGPSASPQIFNETFVVKMVIAIVSPLDEKEKGAKAGRQIWVIERQHRVSLYSYALT